MKSKTKHIKLNSPNYHWYIVLRDNEKEIKTLIYVYLVISIAWVQSLGQVRNKMSYILIQEMLLTSSTLRQINWESSIRRYLVHMLSRIRIFFQELNKGFQMKPEEDRRYNGICRKPHQTGEDGTRPF